jgi:hypothetical protein
MKLEQKINKILMRNVSSLIFKSKYNVLVPPSAA